MSAARSLLVAIPAFNEEQALPGVLEELRQVLPEAAVLVVSDGSRDRTVDVARAAGAIVAELPINLGVGGAMRTAFAYAVRHGFTRVVQLDGDGQHNPADIPRLVEMMESSAADVVIGARFAGTGEYRVGLARGAAMRFLRLSLSAVTRTRLTDATSGFKLIGPRALRVWVRNYPMEYLGDTIEALVIGARAGLTFAQVPVEMRERRGGNPSQGFFRSSLYLVRALVAMTMALTQPLDRCEQGAVS